VKLYANIFGALSLQEADRAVPFVGDLGIGTVVHTATPVLRANAATSLKKSRSATAQLGCSDS